MRSKSQRVAVIMRSFNDADVIGKTLDALRQQSYQDFELWNFDSTSTDGTRDIIAAFNDPSRVRFNDSRSYNPGRVLNEAVACVDADILVFLNSDATPTEPTWLASLLEPFARADVGAVFGRQVARPDCRSLFVKDTERAFGDGQVAADWVHFFSMANSAVRRELIIRQPFETRIQYSEDIEWSWRLRKDGWKIVYAADAVAMHSHNYTLRQSWKRHFGEGKAEAWIFRNGEISDSVLRYCIAPFGMEVLRDLRWALVQRSLDAALHSIPLRFVQKFARWQGLRDGRRAHAV